MVSLVKGRRGEELIKQVREREWGLMLLDEVHVVPAQMFRSFVVLQRPLQAGLTATAGATT